MAILELAECTEETARQVFAWRRDPVTAQNSLHTSLPDWETFWSHFQSDYFQSSLPTFFVRDGSDRVALIRFRPFEGSRLPFILGFEISVVVNPAFRQKGYGFLALQKAEEIAKQRGVSILFAQIRPGNQVSKKLFEKAGYEFVRIHTTQVESLYGREQVDVELYQKQLLLIPKQKGVFLVAEIGSNWRIGSNQENRALAKDLIKMAADAGVDAVKFQTFRAEKVYAPHPGKVKYLKSAGTDKDIMDLFRDLEMAYEDVPYFASLAKEAGVEFMSTPFSVDDFNVVDPYVSHHKNASYELAYVPLLECIARSKKPVFLSTGASFIQEIAWAVSKLKKEGCEDITLLQCTAAYPAQPDMMNLRAMETLRTAFGLQVGLSDHSLDCVSAPVLAVAYGARVIEKHVTMRRSLPGPDQAFAIEPKELKIFVEKVRLAEKMVGSGDKKVLLQEEELFFFAKRAVQATRDIAPGEILRLGESIDILRPGSHTKGAHPAFASSLSGRRARRQIPMGEGVQLGDGL
jgi:sialic acid synthase SpsE/RimJ/RimL family protein N-acetyltransferase